MPGTQECQRRQRVCGWQDSQMEKTVEAQHPFLPRFQHAPYKTYCASQWPGKPRKRWLTIPAPCLGRQGGCWYLVLRVPSKIVSTHTIDYKHIAARHGETPTSREAQAEIFFFLLLLIILVGDVLILLIFSKNQLLFSLIFQYYTFFPPYFCSNLYIRFLLLNSELQFSSFSSSIEWMFSFLILGLSSLQICAFNFINFPLSSALTVLH